MLNIAEGLMASKDLLPYLYGLGGFVVLALVSLFGLIMFASKEPKFEDMVAAQKKAQDELISSLQTTQRSKKSKKWNKLKNKKEKEKKEVAPVQEDEDSGVDDEDPSTESISNIALEVEEVPPPAPAPAPKKKKNKKGKAATVSEAVDVIAESEPLKPIEIPEEIIAAEKEYTQIQQSEPEILIEENIQLECEPEEEPIIEEEIIAPVEEVAVESIPEPVSVAPVEPTSVEPSPVVQPAPVEVKSKKKKASKSKPVPESEGNNELQALLNEAKLKCGIEEMINVLQSKITDSNDGGWQDVDQSKNKLENENGRLKMDNDNLREQLNAQRSVFTSSAKELAELKKQSTHKIHELEKVNESLVKRMQASSEKHTSEMQSKESHVQALQELVKSQSQSPSHQQEIKLLTEENAQLKVVSIRAQKLSDELSGAHRELVAAQQAIETTKSQWTQAEERCNYFEGQLKTIQLHKAESEQMLTQRLQEVSDQLLRSEAEKKQMTEDHEKALETVTVETTQNSSEAADTAAEVDILTNTVTKLNAEVAELNAALSEKDALIAEAAAKSASDEESAQKLSEVTTKLNSVENMLAEKDSALAALQSELEKVQSENAAAADKPTKEDDCEKPITSEEIVSLKATIEQLQSELSSAKQSKDADANLAADLEKLNAELVEKRAAVTTLQESLDSTKVKNNDLREKNWKAMDAVSQAESNISKMKVEICKGLKELHPTVSIPKEDDLPTFFTQYVQNYNATEKEVAVETTNSEEEDRLKVEVEKLTSENESLSGDLKSTQLENEHYKKVLEETASMLSNLQEKVDMEMSEKNARLEEMAALIEEKAAKIKELSSFIETQSADKSEEINRLNDQITELKAARDTSAEVIESKDAQIEQAQAELKKLQESSAASSGSDPAKDEQLATAAKDIKDLSSKLKKTTSERDLLIREYKATKDAKDKLEAILQEAKTKLEEEEKRSIAEKDQANKTHIEQLKSLEDANKAKDAELNKLKEQLEASKTIQIENQIKEASKEVESSPTGGVA